MSHQPFLPHCPWREGGAGQPDAFITTFSSQKLQWPVPYFSLLPKPNPCNSCCLSLSVCAVLPAPPPSNFFLDSHFSLASPGGILRLTQIFLGTPTDHFLLSYTAGNPEQSCSLETLKSVELLQHSPVGVEQCPEQLPGVFSSLSVPVLFQGKSEEDEWMCEPGKHIDSL